MRTQEEPLPTPLYGSHVCVTCTLDVCESVCVCVNMCVYLVLSGVCEHVCKGVCLVPPGFSHLLVNICVCVFRCVSGLGSCCSAPCECVCVCV